MLSITTLNPDHATLFAAIGELAYSGGMTEWDPNDGEVGWLSNILGWKVGPNMDSPVEVLMNPYWYKGDCVCLCVEE